MEAVAREDLSQTEESAGLIAAARAERRAALLPPDIARARPPAVRHIGLSGSAQQMSAFALVALGQGLRVTWHDSDPGRLARAEAWIAARQDEEVRSRRLTPVQRDADRARFQTVADPDALVAAGLVVHAAADAVLARLARQMKGTPQLVLGGAEGALGLALAPSARASELALTANARPETVAAAVQVLRALSLPPLLVGRMPVVGRRVAGAGRAALSRLLAMGVPRRVIAAALDGFGQTVPALPEPDPPPAGLRAMGEAEVTRRWLAAMVNEGLRLVEAGIARRPSDVDFILVAGAGLPRWRGGPMHLADRRGLMVLRAEMHDWRADDSLWEPHPLIDRLIAGGRRLADLDAG
jgi:3-hydroxyacyl-CoA dehydrogenase